MGGIVKAHSNHAGRVVARVGLISDTHGQLDERAERVFQAEGLSAIVHAGDVGNPSILYDLEAIAPLTAVAGNMDIRPMPGWELPGLARTTVAGVRIVVVHRLSRALVTAGDSDVVVYGHTHRAQVEREGGTLLVNPGSATSPRSGPSPSVGILEVAENRETSVRIVMLDGIDL